jgi:hypothetical protein
MFVSGNFLLNQEKELESRHQKGVAKVSKRVVGSRGKDDERGAEVQHKDLSNIEAEQLCSLRPAASGV